MKRQTLVSDNRNWYGADLVSLQEEGFKTLDSIFTQYGSFILSGCEVTPVGPQYKIAPGLVALSGKDVAGNPVKMIVPFEGLASIDLPVYLTLSNEPQTQTREDGAMMAVTYSYKAAASTVKPASGDYFTISSTSPVRFTDAIQDENHQFVTPADRANLQAALDKKLDISFDYVVDSDAKLVGLNNNPNITNVLIKKGTWRSTEFLEIRLPANVKTVIGEPGSLLEIRGGSGIDTYCLCGPDSPSREGNLDYRIEGVTVKSTGDAGVFKSFANMTNCKSISNRNGFKFCYNLVSCTAVSETGTSGFSYCQNLIQCYAQKSDNTINGYFNDCKKMFQCKGAAISSCTSVIGCKAKTYSISTPGGYLGPNHTYGCDDTPNGGWNEIG